MIKLEEWYKIVCDSYLKPPVEFNGYFLPGFPPDHFQISTTGQAGIGTLLKAFLFYQDCIETFELLGSPLVPYHNLLDFGVCWGRIARFFIRNLSKENIYVIDVMDQCVQMCKDLFQTDNFYHVNPYPPTSFPDEKFDVIVGYSVFSHLSEEACHKWMGEFYRILKKDGIAVLTTRSRQFIDRCQSLNNYKELTGYRKALSIMFEDFEEVRRAYDRGEFIHSSNSNLSGSNSSLKSSFYGETFIPEPYAKEAYARYFTLEKYLFEPNRQDQPIMFFRKK